MPRLFRSVSLALLVLLITVPLATLCSQPACAAGWYDPNWAYRKKITINNTKVTANLTNFPVLINLTTDTDLAADAQDDGDDILFTSVDGTTKLSHEIESFDDASGQLVSWVKIPSLSGSTDTEIYMYYGNASCGSQQDAANVWDSNYVMVQHLEESSGQHLDSTSNDNDSISVTVTQQGAGIGQMDGADQLNGSGDYIGMGGIGTVSNNTYSLSAWINDANPSPRQEILWADSSGSNERFRFEVYSNGIDFHDNYGMDVWIFGGAIQTDTWHHVVVTYDYPSQVASIYIDGDFKTSDTSFNQVPSSSLDNLRIGHGPPGWWAYYFNGIIDEVRISNTARSADWIQTSYNNQSSPSTFYGVGSEEPLNYQPDNQIRNQGDGAYIGDGIYNTDGSSQTKSQTVDNNVTATYEIKIENDGNVSDTFTVTGLAGGSGWTVTYYDALAGGTDITAQVTGAGWSTGALASAASTEIRVEVTPDGTVAAGSSKDVLVTSTSAGDASQDVVKATTVTAAYLPPGSGGVWELGYQQCEIDILGIVTLVRVNSLGELLDSFVVTGPENKHQLGFNQGTKLTCASGKVLERIEMEVSQKPPSPPAGMEIVGPAYDIVGYISGSVACSIVFSQPARLTLSYDPDWLPENTSSMFMAYYDAEQGWEELKLVVGGDVEAGKITCLIDHASTFAIMVELVPLPPAPVESAPAGFELSNLAINPAQVITGEPVTISIIVKNTGGLKSSYTLTLKVNGEIEQSKEVTLADGESKQVSFSVARDEPGTYPIVVGGLTAEFTVLAPESSPPDRTFWWMVLLAAVIISLVAVIMSWRRGRGG